MTNKELFQLAIEQLKTEPFLKGFKFRKRDTSFIQQEGDLRRHIELDHWSKEGVLIVYPIYMVRFDILLKWFEPYNVKSPQAQQDNPSIGFTGNTGNGNNGGYQTHLHVDIHKGTRKGGTLINPSKYYANTMIYS